MNIDFSKKELYNYKYIPILRNLKRYVFLMWSGGSGKSMFTAQKEIIKSFEKWNRLLWVRKVKDTIKDSVFAELCWVIEQWSLQDYFEATKSPMYIKNKLTWSDMIFRWVDDVEKIKSVKWVTRIWIEEATELEKKDFNQLDIRLRGLGKQLQIICTYNPISDIHWLITDFWNYWNTDDVECLHSTYKDNRFVWEQYDKTMQRLKEQDINMYNIYALGIPGKALQWIIFEKYEIIGSIPAEAKLKWYGLDFGFNDPTVLVWIYEYNGWIILDEELYKSWLITADIVNFLKENEIKKSDYIVWDNSRPEAIEEIRKAGYNSIPCKKGDDSVIEWINLIKSMPIYVTARSKNWIKEFSNYSWKKKPKQDDIYKDEPIDAFNHFIDAGRYGVTKFFKKLEDFDIIIW